MKGEKSKHGTQQMREEGQATQGGREGRCRRGVKFKHEE